MLFKPEHVEMIKTGKKTMTRRAWKKPMVKVGNVYKCKTKLFSKEHFAEILVTSRFEQRLGDISEVDCIKEGYEGIEAFKEIWIKINGSWDDNQWVWVIGFERVMNKLVKKIEALYNEKRDKREFSGEYRGGWDDCVERVSAIIHAEFAEKDKPDCEGWHYNKEVGMVFVRKDSDWGYVFTGGWDNAEMIRCSEIEGKWISLSAIVPKSEG